MDYNDETQHDIDYDGIHTTGIVLLGSIGTLSSALVLLRQYLNAPHSYTTAEGRAEAMRQIERVKSGDWNRERKEAIERSRDADDKEQLFAEVHRLIVEITGGTMPTNPRRHEKREFRRVTALKLLRWIADGRSHSYMRAQLDGASGFVIDRAYKDLKRRLGVEHLSNAALRQLIRDNTNQTADVE